MRLHAACGAGHSGQDAFPQQYVPVEGDLREIKLESQVVLTLKDGIRLESRPTSPTAIRRIR